MLASHQSSNRVRQIIISPIQAGQRVDNFLLCFLKGLPKSRLYRIIRKGEVRVNKKRIDVSYRLAEGDVLRIPPVRLAEKPIQSLNPSIKLKNLLLNSILYEDDQLIILNKPSGMAVHGGSGVSLGLIEALRKIRPEAPFLELVHRLDRETSGCIMIAKRRSILTHLHEALKSKTIKKNLFGTGER